MLNSRLSSSYQNCFHRCDKLTVVTAGLHKVMDVRVNMCILYIYSRKLRFPDFITTAQDGGKIVSLTHRLTLPPGNTLAAHFC